MSEFATGTQAGWEKYEGSPVLGGDLGTCFDLSVMWHDGEYRMYFSWRPQKSVALSTSKDGLNWSHPQICIGPRETEEGWEDDLNRPSVVFRNGLYHMWYTGQYLPGEAAGTSHIFYATSQDGVRFERVQLKPVIAPEAEWEKQAVMCPDVLWCEEESLYKMWYSAGEQYEPNAIGYATSPDGVNWTKCDANPIFQADPETTWEQHKAAACQVTKTADGWYTMFYIGYHNEHYAQIGLARSRDGITNWQRHPQNPIIAPTPGAWDDEACYKPYAIYDGSQWKLWYNGRSGTLEQIGVALHDGYDLGFDS